MDRATIKPAIIEQLIYEAGRLPDAASLLNRLSRE